MNRVAVIITAVLIALLIPTSARADSTIPPCGEWCVNGDWPTGLWRTSWNGADIFFLTLTNIPGSSLTISTEIRNLQSHELLCSNASPQIDFGLNGPMSYMFNLTTCLKFPTGIAVVEATLHRGNDTTLTRYFDFDNHELRNSQVIGSSSPPIRTVTPMAAQVFPELDSESISSFRRSETFLNQTKIIKPKKKVARASRK